MAKKIFFTLPIALLLATAGCRRTLMPVGNNRPDGDNWRLVWSDEFDGDTLNQKNWSYELGGG